MNPGYDEGLKRGHDASKTCRRREWVVSVLTEDEEDDHHGNPLPLGLAFHLSRCPSCRRLARDLQRINAVLKGTSSDGDGNDREALESLSNRALLRVRADLLNRPTIALGSDQPRLGRIPGSEATSGTDVSLAITGRPFRSFSRRSEPSWTVRGEDAEAMSGFEVPPVLAPPRGRRPGCCVAVAASVLVWMGMGVVVVSQSHRLKTPSDGGSAEPRNRLSSRPIGIPQRIEHAPLESQQPGCADQPGLARGLRQVRDRTVPLDARGTPTNRRLNGVDPLVETHIAATVSDFLPDADGVAKPPIDTPRHAVLTSRPWK